MTERRADTPQVGFLSQATEFVGAAMMLILGIAITIVLVLAVLCVPVAVIAVTGDLIGLWDVQL